MADISGGSSAAASAAHQEAIPVDGDGSASPSTGDGSPRPRTFRLTPSEQEAEAKATALRDIPAPSGYRRFKVPPPSRTRSIVFDHGVKFEQDIDKPDTKKQRWFCACSERCRELSMDGKSWINCQEKNTGNATRHLREAHGITSAKSESAKKTRETRTAIVSKHKEAVMKSSDPGRVMMLMYVKVFIISHLLAFSLSDSQDIRAFFEVCCEDTFPRTTLYPQMIKHFVAELYSATVSKFSYSIRKAIAGAGGAVLHANFDLWTSKLSNEKYIGLRLFWCTSAFVLDSALVAVKLFQPSADLTSSEQLSDILLIWVQEVLKEFGLDTNSLFCTVTDAGSDAQRLCLKVLTSAWEWCFPHMLNCVLVEAFGTNASRQACKNIGARKVIDAVKKVVEHLSKSTLMKARYDDIQVLLYGKSTKLVNAVPHRWISTCNVLEEILRSWQALKEHYQKNEQGGSFPLAQHKTVIEELYSLMKPIAVIMKESQETGVPTGLSTFVALVMLRADTLDITRPLEVTVPRKITTTGGAHTSATTTIDRPAASLQDVTTTTRTMLAAALDKRFFNKRYDAKVVAGPPSEYIFEMAACMSPSLHTLPWLTAMCSSEQEAGLVNKLIKGKVVDLMVKLAEGAGAQPGKVTGGDSSGTSASAPPPSKRARVLSTVGTSEKTKRLLKSGVFGGSKSSTSTDDGPTEVTMKEVCQQELDRFMARFVDTTVEEYPLEVLLGFWAEEGKALYPNMARAARVLLSVPASSAVLERDFSTAGRLITGAGRRLSGAYVEMVLFLNGNQEYIPLEVPKLSPSQGLEAVPRRLSNPNEQTESLSVGEVVPDTDADEYADESLEYDIDS